MDAQPERLWTVIDVSHYLSMSRQQIYRLRREEGLPAMTIGGVLRFRPGSVREWAEQREASDGGKVKMGRPPKPQPDRRRRRPRIRTLP